MALRNILNHSLRKLKPYRQFSSSTIISKNLYKSSLPILSTPWLMLPPDVKDGPNGPSDNYWNIIDKSIVKMDRPIAHGSVLFNTKCVGSAKGWVAFVCDSDGSLFLANPYATEASCRKLPGLPEGIHRDGLHFILVGDPPSNNFLLLNYSYGKHGCEIGNSNGWRHNEFRPSQALRSRLAYNRKANTVYESHLERSGKLQIIWWHPLMDCKCTENRWVLSPPLDPNVIGKYMELNEGYPEDHGVETYLVVDTEENNPSLFFVIRHFARQDGIQWETKDIELYKIDLEGDGKLERVESIGDQALFIGRNSEPFFISTHKCSGLKPNCVYVAEDLGYYDLETKSITPFLSLGDLANIRPHVYWVAPPYSYV
ncbi:uncharacterized protein LOC141654969 [Silene latifolia]|uniref:uncharacterized protein LOC141654969 n=1 Tax=Silene latifolia TaxID=37657 RepID=UPI003D771165